MFENMIVDKIYSIFRLTTLNVHYWFTKHTFIKYMIHFHTNIMFIVVQKTFLNRALMVIKHHIWRMYMWRLAFVQGAWRNLINIITGIVPLLSQAKNIQLEAIKIVFRELLIQKENKMKRKQNPIIVPEGLQDVLLHACCAPCSSAIVEWMINHGIRPTIFYYNPNIFPREEYNIRKDESKRHADSLGLPWVDGDYDHQRWLAEVKGMEEEPERGARCLRCFRFRLIVTALQARELHIQWFTTTLASSRWKSIEQITQAGLEAQVTVAGTSFWAQNWRKGGLSDRRNQLLREYGFYNQQYCGCEYSMRKDVGQKNI